ncbi:hypothetical protein AVEN_33880-1 [Araneus ventricosus]|uniref:Uncharacterized protein n=1 Tax=Araneus ventricosus TaxID=182803 RepID=A0A4Y2VH28_ARAVE|nr:hypothetical protein AVEN_33880-1 [Araneus ventricosus]
MPYQPRSTLSPSNLWRKKVLKISRLAQRASMPNMPRSTLSPYNRWRRKGLKISRLAHPVLMSNYPRSTYPPPNCEEVVLKISRLAQRAPLFSNTHDCPAYPKWV